MKLDVPKLAKWVILVLLSGYTISMIIQPTIDLFGESTLTVTTNEETEDKTQPFKWPSVVVCKNPIIKDQESYNTFMSKVLQGAFDLEAEKQAFYTEQEIY